MSLPVVVLVMSKDNTAEIKGEPTLASMLELVERAIVAAVHRSESDWSATARALGMSRPGVYKMRKRLGLE